MCEITDLGILTENHTFYILRKAHKVQTCGNDFSEPLTLILYSQNYYSCVLVRYS